MVHPGTRCTQALSIVVLLSVVVATPLCISTLSFLASQNADLGVWSLDAMTPFALGLLAVVVSSLRASSGKDQTALMAFTISFLAACFLPPAAAVDGHQFDAAAYTRLVKPQLRFEHRREASAGEFVVISSSRVVAPSLHSTSLQAMRLRGGQHGTEVASTPQGTPAEAAKFSLDTAASEVSRATSSADWDAAEHQQPHRTDIDADNGEDGRAAPQGSEFNSGMKAQATGNEATVERAAKQAGKAEQGNAERTSNSAPSEKTAKSEGTGAGAGAGREGLMLGRDINRMQSELPLAEDSHQLRKGLTLKMRVWVVNGDIYCRWKVFGDVGEVLVHWGLAVKDADEWTPPHLAGFDHIVPQGSWRYKDRAVRTPLVAVPEGRLQATMRFPGGDAEGLPLGVRFSVLETASAQWYPGGMGGNYFMPIKPVAEALAAPRVKSFTGALDLAKMKQDVEESSEEASRAPKVVKAEVIKLGKKEQGAEAAAEVVAAAEEEARRAAEAEEAAARAEAVEGVPRLEAEGKQREAATKAKEEKRRHRGEEAHYEGLQIDIAGAMWNAAQRQKRWLDGHREPVSMRIQRSPSFESAVVDMQRREEERQRDLEDAAALWVSQQARLYVAEVEYHNAGGRHKGSLRVTVTREKEVEIQLLAARRDKIGLAGNHLKLHWGVWTKDEHWGQPPVAMTSKLAKTTVEGKAATTEMTPLADGRNGHRVALTVSGKEVLGLSFVLRDDSTGQWYKQHHSDFTFPVTEAAREQQEAAQQKEGRARTKPDRMVRTASGSDVRAPGGGVAVAQQIMDAESRPHMTLMHRYNKAADLVQQTPPGAAGRDSLLTIFCWLRYSQTRQVTWQRNYNTKPRELSAAAESLNKLLAWRWKNGEPVEKELLRMLLGTVGRGGSGGDGQAIRDEILHIMHRHGLPETKGNFMEEWHQKLHNNSTPDDITICQAYLAFLHSNGNLGEFYRVLEENGITRDRLRSFERPINTDPWFFGHLKDGLIHDFNNYLRILKNVHAGADLDKSVEVSRWMLDGHLNALLDRVLREKHAHGQYVVQAMDAVTEARQLLASRMVHEGEVWKLRDLLYLDLALEAQVRLLAERSIGAFDKVAPEHMAQALGLWAGLALENMIISASPGSGAMLREEEKDAVLGNEMKASLRDWSYLVEEAHKGLPGGWAVRGMAVVERMRRLLGDQMDWLGVHVQDKAEYLGHGLATATPEKTPERWAITLFTEELIRGGGCSFVMSAVLRRLDGAIRAMGGGSYWQVISAGGPGAVGRMERVEDLLSVQSKTYEEPTVLLAKSVSGEEEVPAGVVGVITCDAPDLLAHISVRARNLRVLFATCFDEEEWDTLDAFVAKHVACSVVDGEVSVAECDPGSAPNLNGGGAQDGARAGTGLLSKLVDALGVSSTTKPPKAPFTTWCYAEKKIDPDASVKDYGAKSSNIVRMRRTLPEWIKTPASVVVPFGVLERVLKARANAKLAARYAKLLRDLGGDGEEAEAVLEELREVTLALEAPKELKGGLGKAMEESGLVVPGELEGAAWEEAFGALKQVWASRWNARAFYSCRRSRMDPDSVQMAVLVQRLVEAEYAFVVHTVNPSTGDASEMFAEVVVGLGESLVGNFPGRALGFVCKKDGSGAPEVQSLPSKSKSLHGAGLIFRSDSNAEDLPGFAGAGLYDSVPMTRNEARTVCYCKERLMMEQGVAEGIMLGICKLAADVEAAMGGVPQDIEGCYKNGEFYVVQTRPQV